MHSPGKTLINAGGLLEKTVLPTNYAMEMNDSKRQQQSTWSQVTDSRLPLCCGWTSNLLNNRNLGSGLLQFLLQE
ncbi:hypothetical protein CsSME_00010726 [Camellia sinensis var. sinensis]